MIITIFIIFFYLKEPPSSLEMLMMIWFCGIHISCQGNGFMFNSAWGWKTCRKLCWIYDHICKAEKGVPLIPNCPFQNVHPSQNQRHGLCAYAKCDGQQNIHLLSEVLMRHPRICCPTPSANEDDIMSVIRTLTIT